MARISNEVINRLKNGDEEALKEVFDCYQKIVYSIALNITRNNFDAEDVMIDTFTLVWKNIQTYSFLKGDFDKWLISIAYNSALSFNRLNKIYRKYVINDENNIIIESKDNDSSIKDYTNELLDILDVNEYNIFILKIIFNCSFQKICNVLKIKDYECRKKYKEALKKANEYFKK